MKVGIITINNSNYGNRLQNYALQENLKKMKIECMTIENIERLNEKYNTLKYFFKNVKHILYKYNYDESYSRLKYFQEFNKSINFSKKTFNWFDLKWLKQFDYFITGSDQVWNPYFRLSDFDLLTFATPNQRIAFSASFGISELPEQYKEKAKNELMKFKAISVREDVGKKIINELLPEKEVEVLVDPTMLLTPEEWDKVSKKPKQIKIFNGKKYILNYFLGNLSEERKKEIARIAKENDCEIINILDKKSPFYTTGPSEFLWLEKNAFLICTDSFHSCVFAILYNRPFIIFDREDSNEKMNSRLDTLINKFHLKNRKFEGKITEENLQHDYTEAYEILEIERAKSDLFLRKALEIESNEKE